MSEEKKFNKITEQDKRSYGVVALALRPNQRSTYGEGNLSGKQLQERFDRLANLVIDKYNAMAETLSGTDVLDYLNLPDLPNGTNVTLKDLVGLIVDDDLDLVVEKPGDKDKSKAKLKDILAEDYRAIEEISADLATETAALRKLEALVEAFLSSEPDENGAIDKLKEVIAYITENRDLIETLTKANETIRKDFDTHEERFTELVDGKISKSSISDSTDSDDPNTVLSSRGAQALKQAAKEYTDTEAEKINKKFENYLPEDALSELFQTSDGKIVAQKDLFVGQIFEPNKVVTNRELSEKLGGAEQLGSVADTLLEIFGTNGSYGLEYYIGKDYARLYGIGNCTESDVVVGSKVKSIPVTEIGANAFRDSAVRTIVIPEGVEEIASYAFSRCKNLLEITVPKSLIYVGIDLLSDTYQGLNIYISDIEAWCNIEMNSSLLLGMSSLVFLNGEVAYDIDIPKSITKIRRNTFKGWRFLNDITLHDEITEIDQAAFMYCESLGSIVIPNSVTLIGDMAFDGCSALTDVTLPNQLADLPEFIFSDCISLKSITIPDSVERIHSNAFYNNFELNHVVMSNRLIAISDEAFGNCKALEMIELPDSLTFVGNSVFEGCSSLKNIVLPDNIDGSINNSTFKGCINLESVTIPVSVSAIFEDAFFGCTALKDVYYRGSAEDWGKIDIREGNEALANATIHYNYGG